MAAGEAVIKVTADASGVEAGVGKARKSLASLSQSAGQTSDAMAAANERTARSIDRFVQKQQLAAATMGKSATEAKLFELAQRGASAAQLKSAESALKAVDAYNRQEAASARAQAAAAKFGAIVATGALIAAAGLMAMGRGAVDALDEFNDLSDATGSSIENISALDRVARENGQAFESTASILVRFNKVLSDTDDEGKKAAQVIKALGLDAEKLKQMDPAEALRQTAVALAQFSNDGDKARAVQLLFGKSVQEAAPFLKDLAEKTELTGVATTKAARDAEEFNKNLFRLKANASDAARSLTADLLPALNKIFEKGKEQGFFALFGFDKEFFEKKRLAGLAGDVINLKRQLDELKRGMATGILGPEALPQIEAVTAALEKAKGVFREADKGFTPSTAGAGRGSVNPAFVTPSLGTIPDAPTGSKKDPLAEAKQYLESLEKQLQTAKEMTVYEKLLDDLKAKRFAVTPALERQLKAAATEVDLTKAQAKAQEDLIKTRERTAQMQQAADDAALANIETQIQTNEQLRDEIEILGLEGRARAAVEQARLSSAIALKEEALVMAQNADASATVITSLEREIELLKQRQGLIGVRADREEAIDLSKATEKERQQFAEDMKSDLSGAFQAAFRDTDNPIKAFAETLASTVFDRLSKAAADALADAFLSQMGGGEGGWVGLIASLFGGGGSLAGAGGGAGNYNFGGGFDGGGYTGNGARSGGLDGKGGFMAMLHPKETVLDHTKGQGAGGGASITVIQNITTTDTVSKSELESKLRDSNRQMVAALDRSQRINLRG